ncbi:helix-turn-helix domain-containing protein [Hyphococcus flavus]|uniref:Helix-turn-helix domain-containing protein n=1 Tax=Hyphococcus flavus TaxID=1866326 RepID=A0AAE9ZI09_9PROT|nr:helix-turn-helix domain-containing protein [Hyphococcus flavus]WDI32992.1 helix-turn-helix domain-containing protein [Hyphococcus flavus]
MQFEPVNIIQIAIASPAALAGVFVAARSRFYALGALLIVFAMHMAFNVIEETGAAHMPVLVTPALSLLYGPLFFLFICELIFINRKPRVQDLLHLAPFAVALFLSNGLQLVRLMSAVSLVAYGGACLFYIWRFHRAADATRSDSQTIRLNWIVAVFAVFAGLTAIDVLRMMTIDMHPAGFRQIFYAVNLLAAAGLFAVIVYYAFNRPAYFEGLTDTEFRSVHAGGAVGITPHERSSFERLDETIKRQALYRRPHLTLFDLANETGIPERDVSRLVNQVSGRNFCDYINTFRVQEAARRLTAPEDADTTILTIAFESGFSSKSTFNAVFKRAYGVTPSTFRKPRQDNS